MTISPLMVELFFPIDTMDLQQQQTDLQDIFTEGTSGAPFPGPWVRVESIISQRGETWKSKALLIYHFKYILFVSSWKFSLFLEFYWLLPSICLLHDAAFCRRVGWWSCVMVTVLLKKEIGNNVSFSRIFLEANVKILGLILYHLRESVVPVRSWLIEEKRKCSLQLLSHCSALPHTESYIILNTLFASITPTSENEVIRGINW